MKSNHLLIIGKTLAVLACIIFAGLILLRRMEGWELFLALAAVIAWLGF